MKLIRNISVYLILLGLSVCTLAQEVVFEKGVRREVKSSLVTKFKALGWDSTEMQFTVKKKFDIYYDEVIYRLHFRRYIVEIRRNGEILSMLTRSEYLPQEERFETDPSAEEISEVARTVIERIWGDELIQELDIDDPKLTPRLSGKNSTGWQLHFSREKHGFRFMADHASVVVSSDGVVQYVGKSMPSNTPLKIDETKISIERAVEIALPLARKFARSVYGKFDSELSYEGRSERLYVNGFEKPENVFTSTSLRLKRSPDARLAWVIEFSYKGVKDSVQPPLSNVYIWIDSETGSFLGGDTS